MKEELHKDIGIELLTPKQVMEAFLSGNKLINSKYCNGWGNDLSKEPEHYLYLDESGYIAEEDGATAKNDRIPLSMRGEERWFIINSQDKEDTKASEIWDKPSPEYLGAVSQEKTNWEEEYKERFSADYADLGRDETTEDAINFIRSLLTEKEEEYKKTLNSGKKMYEIGKKEGMEEILRKIEGMKKDHEKQGKNITHEKDELWACCDCYDDRKYNQALQDAIEIIKGK
jgi:Fe-S oxidoreductase